MVDLDVDGKNIGIYLKVIECLGVYWVHLAQGKFPWLVLMIAVMYLRVP